MKSMRNISRVSGMEDALDIIRYSRVLEALNLAAEG